MVNTQVWKLVASPWKKEPAVPARPVFVPKTKTSSDEEQPKSWKAAKPAAAGAE